MKKGDISTFLRLLKLIKLIDYFRYLYLKIKNRKVNRTFIQNNPDVKLPSDYLIYESFQIDYEEYFTKSRDSAKWVLDHFEKYINLKGIKILDWGCGPGRIIRHMSTFLDDTSEIFGTDYNKNSINWCKNNLPGINFNANTLEAKLPYNDNFFDAIYGISIFTHLSEKMHFEWTIELHRVLKPRGVLFLTTHGDAFMAKLTESEKKLYLSGELVVRGMTKEGHRTFSAYHPELFMQKLFMEMKILNHIENPSNGSKAQQDIWLLQKL